MLDDLNLDDLLKDTQPMEQTSQYFYYGLVDTENKGWGFVDENDPRVTPDMVKLTEEEWQTLLDEQSEGKEIVYYEGKVFTAETGRYYLDDDGQWQKKTDEEFETEKAQAEAERIAMLNLTAADVERAIYKAKGIDFDDIIALCEAQPLSEEGTQTIDIKALKIELKANNFYRGNPYIDAVGTILGFSKQQLDEFFETNDYTKLIG